MVTCRKLAKQGAFQASLANCRIQLDAARLMVLAAASHLDRSGNKAARGTIAAAKVCEKKLQDVEVI